ncbi:MAG: hypothetical protein HYY17_06410 [Planctomycetes bacterium]|nr:hypothetical protein [Planctomycetota bacterium]
MKPGDANNNPETHAGIRLILEEIRDLRKESIEDRRRADERLERLFLRIDGRFDAAQRKIAEERKRSDAAQREIVEERKRFNRTLMVMLSVARDLRGEQHQQAEVLHEILRAVRVRGNGSRGNGK